MNIEICQRFEKATELLNQRWIGLIVHQLLSGHTRFNHLQKSLKISGKVLSQRLKLLEDEAILTRQIYAEVPVRVEYRLTAKGKALKPVIAAIQSWADTWQ